MQFDGQTVKRDHVLISRVSRSKEIGEAEMFSGGLARKSEAHLAVLIVNDQVVSVGLALVITINHFRHEQLFTYGAFFDLFIDRTHFIAHQCLILFKRHPTLLELPLTLEQRGLIYEREYIVERDVVNDTRAEKGRGRNRHVATHVGTFGVRRIASAPRAWLRRLAYTEFLFFTDQIFDVVRSIDTQSCSCFLRLLCPISVTNQLVHRVQTGKGVTRVIQLTVIERLQIVFDVTTR